VREPPLAVDVVFPERSRNDRADHEDDLDQNAEMDFGEGDDVQKVEDEKHEAEQEHAQLSDREDWMDLGPDAGFPALPYGFLRLHVS
jgi:hypothetical protein